MRIGLIAMSGVRAFDQELMDFGLTLPGFVERSKVIASMPSLGLLTLAGTTPPEFECCYLEVEDIGELDVLPELDLVAISCLSAQVFEAYSLADRYRAMKVPVVMGGLHVSVLPDEAARHCDAVVIGEAEPVWPQLLGDAARGRLQPRYQARAQYDLAASPLPAYELLETDRYNRLTIQASRGCPLKCDFCAASILIAPQYRQKPIRRVLAELDRICCLWPHPFIEFADDNAFVNKRYWKRLLPELAARNIRWFAETDISLSHDDELLGLMRRSGCAQVLVGLESPQADSLQGIEHRRDAKYVWFRNYLEAIQRIQSHGITVNGCFVLGLDGHGPEIFDAVYDFAMRAELFDVQITIQTPFPGTPLYERLAREKRLLHAGDWRRCTLFDINYQPDRMSVEELRQGFRNLAGRLYADDVTQWRRENFYRKYLHSSSAAMEVWE